MKSNHLKRNLNSRGQTLVLVIFLLTIALGMVITVSERFYKTVRIFSRDDSLLKATGAAEALAERLLALDNPTLESYINNCGSNCSLQITDPAGISSIATATVSLLGNIPSYVVSLNQSSTREVNMDTYQNNRNFWICWNSNISGSTAPSVSALFVSGSPGNYDVNSYAYNSVGSTNTFNGFSTAAPLFGYNNCFRINGQNTPALVRLRSYYSDVDVTVVPDNGLTIPQQGLRIEIVGRSSEATKTMTVTRTPVTLPTDFDYVLFQKSTTQPLSN